MWFQHNIESQRIKYLPQSTGGDPVHAGAHLGVFNTLRGHCVLLHTYFTTDPTDQVRPPHPEREPHPRHCVDVLPVLVALPHRQHGASMSHVLFHQEENHHSQEPLTECFFLCFYATRSRGLCVLRAKLNTCKFSQNGHTKLEYCSRSFGRSLSLRRDSKLFYSAVLPI